MRANRDRWNSNSVSRWLVPLLFLLATISAEASPFGEGTVFAKLVGDWEARGELTNADDGSVTTIRETWTGKQDGDAAFEMSGTRTFGDEEPHTFTWRFLYNPTTELIECDLTMSTMDQPMRFEVQVNTENSSVTMKTPFGEGGELHIVNRVETDKMAGEVKMTDANGNQSVSGTVEHRRPGQWDAEN